ncbi:MAG: hypothetical protein B6A08_10600 [Sorangiineae bacterium NIC37A_2]|nr:MAG: hypothetical protein B6A08_10600 [Sorangiineae bacterium NIC37A_2]
MAKSKAGPRLPLASKFDRASKGLSDRRTQVLYAVVTEYIRTGLPSGSRTLAETYGLDLSPATIRHVLKELEEEDFLTQPHTSAGRLPTERALRLYVDALMRVENVPPETAERIRAFFQAHRGAALEARFAEALGGLLADLSHRPALVLRSRTTSSTIRTIRFIPTRPSELLAVIVLDDATVENRFIRLDSPLDPPSLERLHNLLDEKKNSPEAEPSLRFGHIWQPLPSATPATSPSCDCSATPFFERLSPSSAPPRSSSSRAGAACSKRGATPSAPGSCSSSSKTASG